MGPVPLVQKTNERLGPSWRLALRDILPQSRLCHSRRSERSLCHKSLAREICRVLRAAFITDRAPMLKNIGLLVLLLPANARVSSPGRGMEQSRPIIPLDSTTKFVLTNARVLWVNYRGRHALKLAPLVGHERDVDQALVATLTETDFTNGTIEIDVSGTRREGYSKAEDVSGFKGIVGISFRAHGDSAERFYIRPENSRLENQIFRNRSTQYESDPDYSWQRLRQESPGEYESYVDVEPGAWTKLRIEVDGRRARLYVNAAAQPCLVVNDLKLGESRGKIALWARISTEAYFSNLRVEPRR